MKKQVLSFSILFINTDHLHIIALADFCIIYKMALLQVPGCKLGSILCLSIYAPETLRKIECKPNLDKRAFCLHKAVSNFSFCWLVGHTAKFLDADFRFFQRKTHLFEMVNRKKNY